MCSPRVLVDGPGSCTRQFPSQAIPTSESAATAALAVHLVAHQKRASCIDMCTNRGGTFPPFASFCAIIAWSRHNPPTSMVAGHDLHPTPSAWRLSIINSGDRQRVHARQMHRWPHMDPNSGWALPGPPISLHTLAWHRPCTRLATHRCHRRRRTHVQLGPGDSSEPVTVPPRLPVGAIGPSTGV